MIINVLCIGDVVGKPGRVALSRVVPDLVQKHDIHCVICNAENAAGGSGLTPQIYDKLRRYGIHLLTLGDHALRRQEIIPLLEQTGDMARPANYPVISPGKGYGIFQTQAGPKVAAIAVMGRLFMKPPTDCPFRAVDDILKQLPADVRIVFVDVHAEATSEKVALGWHLDGRVSCVFGTHTHVPTADGRILPNGTAYITDLGMSGPHDSVLGRKKERVIRAMTTHLHIPFDVATDDVRVCGALVRVDSATGKAEHIERIEVRDEQAGEE